MKKRMMFVAALTLALVLAGCKNPGWGQPTPHDPDDVQIMGGNGQSWEGADPIWNHVPDGSTIPGPNGEPAKLVYVLADGVDRNGRPWIIRNGHKVSGYSSKIDGVWFVVVARPEGDE